MLAIRAASESELDALGEGGAEQACSATISVREKGGQWQLALNLLSLLPDARLVPDEINHTAAINAFSGQWQLALKFAEPDARVEREEEERK